MPAGKEIAGIFVHMVLLLAPALHTPIGSSLTKHSCRNSNQHALIMFINVQHKHQRFITADTLGQTAEHFSQQTDVHSRLVAPRCRTFQAAIAPWQARHFPCCPSRSRKSVCLLQTKVPQVVSESRTGENAIWISILSTSSVPSSNLQVCDLSIVHDNNIADLNIRSPTV